MAEKIVLEYIGPGDFIVGIPARDLLASEIAELEARMSYKDLKKFLVGTGLYHEVKPKKETKAKKEKGKVTDGS
jgi:hypothetical protein